MLIILDNSLENCFNDEIVIGILGDLARRMKEHNHFVVAERELIKKIISIPKLEDECKVTYNYIRRNMTRFGRVKDSISVYVKVTGNENKEIIRCEEEGKVIFKIPIKYFSTLERLSIPKLISEDMSDCEFYEALAKAYAKESELKCGVNLELMNGGGDNTCRSIKYLVDKKIWGLAIVDSDKKCYIGQEGKTCKKAREEFEKHKSTNIIDFHGLAVREKENLVPPGFYKLCHSSKNSNGSLDFLDWCQKNGHVEICQYGNIKKGIKFAELDNNITTLIIEFMVTQLENRCNKEKSIIISRWLDHLIVSGSNNQSFDIENFLYNSPIPKEDVVKYTGFDVKRYLENWSDNVVMRDMISQISNDSVSDLIHTEIIFKEIMEIRRIEDKNVVWGTRKILNEFKNSILTKDITNELQNDLYEYKDDEIKRNVLEEKRCIVNELFKSLPAYVKNEWKCIATKIMGWGCCYEGNIP